MIYSYIIMCSDSRFFSLAKILVLSSEALNRPTPWLVDITFMSCRNFQAFCLFLRLHKQLG